MRYLETHCPTLGAISLVALSLLLAVIIVGAIYYLVKRDTVKDIYSDEIFWE